MKKTPNVTRLTLHVLQTLPDSLRLRRALLEDVALLLPRGHENRIHAAHQLRLLRQMEQAQREFRFDGQPGHDGHHNGKDGK